MKNLNRISQTICLLAVAAAGYIMISGKGLTDGSFGPAAYYYTDIPDWQSRFYNSTNLAVQNPQSYLRPSVVISVLLAFLLLFCLMRIDKGMRS